MRLDDLLDAARADALAGARDRARSLARQAEVSATFAGTLLDLAEHGAAVSLTCAGGRRVDGTIRAIGVGLVVVDDRAGDVVGVQLGAIALVRPAPGTTAASATGARSPALDLTLGELLARLVEDRPEVAMALVTGDVVAGELLAVGEDVATVRVAPGAGGVAYVSLSSVASTRFRSG